MNGNDQFLSEYSKCQRQISLKCNHLLLQGGDLVNGHILLFDRHLSLLLRHRSFLLPCITSCTSLGKSTFISLTILRDCRLKTVSIKIKLKALSARFTTLKLKKPVIFLVSSWALVKQTCVWRETLKYIILLWVYFLKKELEIFFISYNL